MIFEILRQHSPEILNTELNNELLHFSMIQ